ncbi:MAG TPA: hypothetical protein PKO41_09185, partial [Dokdonella sp.]|nr:hypothetical protein [Dokdonella sp.]
MSSNASHPVRLLPVAVTVFVAVFVVQAPLVFNPGYFAADELQWWARADVTRAADLPWLAWGDVSAFQYRPLTFNLWLLLAWAFAATPWIMHAAFVALGATNTALLGAVMLRFGASQRATLAACLAFASNPYVVYTHGWTATLADLLVVLAGLGSVLLSRSIGPDASPRQSNTALLVILVLVALALMAKESAVVLPVLLAAAAWRTRNPRFSALVVVTSAVLVLAYLGLRWPVLAQAGSADPAYAWSADRMPRRVLEYLLFPAMPPLLEAAPVLAKSAARIAAAGVVLCAFLAALASANRWLPVAWLVLQLGLLAPVLVLGIAYNHYAYMASTAAIAIPALAWSSLPRPARIVVCVAAAITALHGMQVMFAMH